MPNNLIQSTYYHAEQQRQSLRAYYQRVGQYVVGEQFSDPRNQDQLDRGIELQWRTNVLRREIADRAQKLGRDRHGECDETIRLRHDLKPFGLELPALLQRQAN